MKFKVGDKVRVTKIIEEDDNEPYTRYIGKEGVVVNLLNDNLDYPIQVKIDSGGSFPFSEKELELAVITNWKQIFEEIESKVIS